MHHRPRNACLARRLAQPLIGSLIVFFSLGLYGGCDSGPAKPASGMPPAQPTAPSPQGAVASAERYKVPVASSATRGSEHAKVTVVVFCDFQCPFCKRAEPSMRQLQQDYAGSVRVVYKHNPLSFHDRALPASLAVEAAGEQGRFWEMHDLLFADTQPLTDERLLAHARTLGLDLGRFQGALSAGPLEQKVKDDQKLAEQLDVRGTPTFFINGRKLIGARPYTDIKAIVDEELHQATELLVHGVAATALYDTIIKDGLTTAPVAEQPQKSEPPENDHTVYKVDAGRSPSRGPQDAAVTIVLFSDFQCPFCQRIDPMMRALEKEFPGKLRVVFKNFPLPFHENARGAALAALAAAEQGKFWQMHDKLFESQQALDRNSLEKYAQELGLPRGRFAAAMDDLSLSASIDADQKLGQAVGVRGTPSLFINGRRVQGALPLSTLRTIVLQELAPKPRGG